jgi:hypothetical protein
LRASCSAGSDLSASAITSVSGARIHTGGGHGGDGGFYNADDAFNVGTSFDVLDEGATNSDALQGTLTYLRADGVMVTATFMGEEEPGRCVFVGTAIG